MAEKEEWFVMRDLKRPNALLPAYKLLTEKGFTVFTPMKWLLSKKTEKPQRRQVPFIPDLLFVYNTKSYIDTIVEKTPTLQYRYLRGQGYQKPMTVPVEDMERFIRAVQSTDNPKYFMPEELTDSMLGKRVRIIGGALNGYEGKLLKVKGSKVKRLIVKLSGVMVAGVEVCPEYIEPIEE